MCPAYVCCCAYSAEGRTVTQREVYYQLKDQFRDQHRCNEAILDVCALLHTPRRSRSMLSLFTECCVVCRRAGDSGGESRTGGRPSGLRRRSFSLSLCFPHTLPLLEGGSVRGPVAVREGGLHQLRLPAPPAPPFHVSFPSLIMMASLSLSLSLSLPCTKASSTLPSSWSWRKRASSSDCSRSAGRSGWAVCW